MRWWSILIFGSAAAAVLAPVAAVVADEIVLRPDGDRRLGRIAGIDDGGVRIELDDEAGTEVVSWDRVFEVRRDGRVIAEDYRQLADDLWRARTRVERGDYRLATDRFDRLFARMLGQTHESALVVAEGRLRCALAAGQHDAAVLPALEVARLRGAGLDTASYAGRRPVLDPTTRLCAAVAPALLDTHALAPLERALAAYDAGGDAEVEAIAAGYRAMVRRQLGLPESEREPFVAGPGSRLLAELAGLEAADRRDRDQARRAIMVGIAERPPWQQAWVHFALGRSFAREAELDDIERGQVHFLHLAARPDWDQPFLTGLALAWTSALAAAVGDEGTRTVVDAELVRRYPRHPVNDVTTPVRLRPHPDRAARAPVLGGNALAGEEDPSP